MARDDGRLPRDRGPEVSAEVSGWVWRNAPVKSGELVVLLALADNAHDDGTGAYPSQDHLAKKSRMTARQVRRCLATLEEGGLIRRQGATAGGVIVWAVVMDGGGQIVRADTDDREGRTSASDRTVREPSSKKNARAQEVKFNGKR